MNPRTNDFGQPIGAPVPKWNPPPFPPHERIVGRCCTLEPLNPAAHADDLYEAFAADTDGRMWTYLFNGPFESRGAFDVWIGEIYTSTDPQFYAIVDGSTQRAAGIASYLRITPAHGCIEVGHLAFAPALQRTTAATEAMYLMMRRAFDLGYRRYEWKCDSLNQPSRDAAERLGFTFEGIFRQAIVVKGRNRDTAWYSIIDADWPERKARFETWLDASNFDEAGRQKTRLSR